MATQYVMPIEGWPAPDPSRALQVFHKAGVTSKLVHHRNCATINEARGAGRALLARPKFFALKILTFKLSDIKILQTPFANPAPSKAFGGMWEGGSPISDRLSQTRKTGAQVYFSEKPTARFDSQSLAHCDAPGTKTGNNQKSTIGNSFSLTSLLRGEMNFPWQSG